MQVYNVTCNFKVKANSVRQVLNYLKEEAGVDFTEAHLFVEYLKVFDGEEQDVDIDLSERSYR